MGCLLGCGLAAVWPTCRINERGVGMTGGPSWHKGPTCHMKWRRGGRTGLAGLFDRASDPSPEQRLVAGDRRNGSYRRPFANLRVPARRGEPGGSIPGVPGMGRRVE